MRAPSTVTIDLNRACSSFDAMAGLDDMARRHGRVVFSVLGGDGRTLWSSEPVDGGDAAVPVHVSLAGQQTIRLVVQPAHDRWHAADVADWADARLGCEG